MTKLIPLLFWFFVAPSTAEAFIFINNGGYNRGARPVANAPMWTNRTVTFRINTNLSVMGGTDPVELSSAQFQAAVNSAVAIWNQTCGSDLRVVVGTNTSTVRDHTDGINTVMWDNRTTAEGSYRGNPNILGFASPAMSGDTVTDCDVVINGENPGVFAVDGSPTGYDMHTILVHEIGHCLGLDHTSAPPTYTSTNPIHAGSVMFAGLSAGDLSKKILSQDELDAMECVNPSNPAVAARSGNFCTSYHGTNGGAAISGTVSGGPSSSRVCGEGTGSAVVKSSSSGGGCVSKAIASDGSSDEKPTALGWTFLFPLLALVFLRKKIVSFFLSIFFLISLSPEASAALELSYTITNGKASLMKNASEFSSAEGSFASTSSEQKKPFDQFEDLYGALTFSDSSYSRWGLYFKKGQTEKNSLSGKNSAGTVLMKKNTSLDSWLIGFNRKYFTSIGGGFSGFLELQLGGGKVTLSQQIEDSTATSHKMEGSAFVFETNAYLGTQFPIWGIVDGLLKVGYARMNSNYFSVKSATGSRYSAFSPGDRIALRSGEDLRLVRNGFSVQVGLSFFNGSAIDYAGPSN
jgi:hypothetical protein